MVVLQPPFLRLTAGALLCPSEEAERAAAVVEAAAFDIGTARGRRRE
eukprot:SAG25_NODE_150_length_13701_cov_6.145640_2_plen_47_part_00